MTPELIVNDIPIDVDTNAITIDNVSKEASQFYSFEAQPGTRYRVTLQLISGDADFTLLDDRALSDQAIVNVSLSQDSIQSVSYDTADGRTMYVQVRALGGDATFKLYVNTQGTIFTRPIIFVTSEIHDGNLTADRSLVGLNAIEKADYLCSTSATKPDDKDYKALLVDGLYRDAVTGTDWVLQPDTTYYRPDGVIPIGTTSENAVFAPVSLNGSDFDLINSVDDCDSCAATDRRVWTGAADPADLFTLYFSNCGGWSTSLGSKGAFGLPNSSNSAALGPTVDDCSSKHAFYCVQQP